MDRGHQPGEGKENKREREGEREREVMIGVFLYGKRHHLLLHYRLKILTSVVSTRARVIYRLAGIGGIWVLI